MDWTQLEREPGKSRHAFVKRLAELRRAHRALTEVNGAEGLSWLDTTAKESVTAFVRRGGGETILVVQNWTGKPASCEVSFKVLPPKLASYLAADKTDRDVKGEISPSALLSKGAKFAGGKSFELGPWGVWISEVVK